MKGIGVDQGMVEVRALAHGQDVDDTKEKRDREDEERID